MIGQLVFCSMAVVVDNFLLNDIMLVVKYVIVYDIIWAFFTIGQSWEIGMCPSDTREQVSWPDSGISTCVRSKPLCISENMEIVSRCCDDEGNWYAAPICSYHQGLITNPCPDNFDWVEKICIYILENTTYPPQCPYEENLPFNQYVSILNPELLPIWMPVKREVVGDYGIDLFRWMEPTSNYKTPYSLCNEYEDCNQHYYFNDTHMNKSCLVYHNTSSIEMVSCDQRYTAICAYQSLPERPTSFCSQSYSQLNPCVQSNYSSHSKCFCKGQMQEYSLAPRVEFHDSYQNLLYSSLDDVCYIGLRNVNGSYIWTNTNSTVRYTNWDEDAIFKESYKYGAMSPGGWIMVETENETDCVLYEAEVPVSKGEIILTYDEAQGFVLKLTNPSSWVSKEDISIPTVSCFTDAANSSVISKIPIEYPTASLNETLFHFQKHEDGPGTYWCEAFLYPYVVPKSSNKYLLRYTDTYTEEYVVLLKTKYGKAEYPITEAQLKEYQRQLAGQIQVLPDISMFQVRIYKILALDESNLEITINFHLANPSNSQPLAQYGILSGYVQRSLVNFTFVKMLGVDHCVGVQTSSSVTWPVTPINTAAKPREGQCVREDGSIMNRYCSGNYIDGAEWLDLDEPCRIQLSTNATVNLTNIISLNNAKEYLDQVIEISKDSSSLVAQDISLISQFLEQIASSKDIDLIPVSRIINQLMEVPEEVLKESQALFNSTDRILYQIQNIINQSKYIGELIDNNFFIISYYINDCNFSVITIQDIDDSYQIHTHNNVDLNNILEMVNLKVALILNEKIMSMLLQENALNSRIIVTIYRNSKFFNEVNKTDKDTDLIIGISFPYISKAIGDISAIYKTSEESQENNTTCSIWKYNLDIKRGYWEEVQRKTINDSIICSYNRPMHFSLLRKTQVNVTFELENLIDSNTAVSNRLTESLTLLKKYYKKFQAIDVELISQLLNIAAEAGEDNLALVTDIINAIVDIPKEVLEESHLTYNATGKILIYFDHILKKHDHSVIIKKDNVYVIVQVLREELFYGFELDNCDKNCNFTLFNKDMTVEEISVIERLDTALLISDDLIQQLLGYSKESYVPKIVTTIFHKQSLFREDYTVPKIATKVVGVSFPGFDGPLNGRLILLYNINLGMALNMATCSVYQIPDDEATIEIGYWNVDGPATDVKNIRKCEFWLPKYFALLYNSVNLTSTLESLLESTSNPEEVLQQTNSIVKNYYEYLQPVDVSIIAILFSKPVEVNEDVLKISVDIVSNIMYIPETVLQTSQEVYNATNLILEAFNKITESYTGTKIISSDNVALIIATLSEIQVYGVTLDNCSEYCSVTVLYNRSISKNMSLNQYDAVLNISLNLIDNLLKASDDSYTPVIVLKIFYNDALFIKVNETRSSVKVFGIHFPYYNQTLSDEVQLAMQPFAATDSSDYNCVSWSTEEETMGGFWSYESRPRDKILICNIYQQNYYSVVVGDDSVGNATQILENIYNTDVSFLAKLYKALDISFYYQELQPYDIYLLSLILLQCNELRRDGLDMLNTIINNILRVPKGILLHSGMKFNALKRILEGINHISNFEETREYSLLNDQFGLVVCQLNRNFSNGVILTSRDIKCTYGIEDAAFVHAENIETSLIISEEVVARALQANDNPKVIVSVFSNKIFFDVKETKDSTVVLGLSVPDVQDELEGGIQVMFNSSFYENYVYDCGYWENLEVWRVTQGENLHSFKKCQYSEATYFTLLNYSNASINITRVLYDIIDTQHYTPQTKMFYTLQLISSNWQEFEALHVYLVSQVLSSVEVVTSVSLGMVANITDSITKLNRQVLVDSQNQYSATDWFLYHLDRIARKIEENVLIATDNFAIISSNNISGIIVEQCSNAKCNVELLFKRVNARTLKNADINAVVLLDSLFYTQNNSLLQMIITVHFTNALFNEGSSIIYKNIGPIIGIVVPSKDDEFNGSLKVYYYSDSNSTEVCAYWNYTIEETSIVKGHWDRNEAPLQPSHTSLCESKHNTHFAFLEAAVNVTSNLEDILNSNLTVTEKLEKLVNLITELVDKLEPVDIYLISKILEYALEEVDANKMNLTSHIISSLFHVPRTVLRESQLKYYATNKILYAIQEMGKSLNPAEIERIVKNNFTIVVYDLKETNMSGLILEGCSNTQCNISVIQGTANLNEIVTNQNLQIAVILSDELLNQIKQSETAGKLVVTIYFSDVLFNEQSSKRDGKVSMVCGVVLPKFYEDFLGNLSVVYKNGRSSDNSNSCAYWKFQVDDGDETINGFWVPQAEPRNKKLFTICEYNHITHFALLLARDNSSFLDANEYKVLDIITAVNSILSIIGISGILLTAGLFERWRKNTGNQILVHFSVAISIKIVLLYVSFWIYADKSEGIVCSVTGAILHYAILSEFCWMLIIAILQFKRFVEVLGGPPKFVLLKACICGWVFPLLPVTLILLVDKKNYNEGQVGICYPSGLGLYLGIWLPLIIIISINFVIYIFIIYNVFHKKTETRDLVNHEILFQWRLALLLFSMLGLTWLFGFLSQIPGLEDIFIYLFCFSASLQGFVMFLFFIVFNKSTRFLYSQSIKLWLYSRGYKIH